jgi:MerR family transcriptional regulator/heat shock protein HspR
LRLEGEAIMVFRNDEEPIYIISVAARLVDMHPQTLRYYERAGLLKPTRSSGKIRLYSQREIERLRKISRLTNELGVNLAGVQQLQAEIDRLRQQLEPDTDADGT